MEVIPEKAGINSAVSNATTIVPSSPFSGIRREISEEDLASPAVQRILLSELDKLQSKVDALEIIESKFYNSDKKAAVLEEKLNAVNSKEVMYSLCLSIGSAVIGFSSLIWDTGYGWFPVAFGSALLVGAIISRVFK